MAVTWEQVLNPTFNEVTPGAVMPTAGASIAASSTGMNRSNQQGAPSASTATPAMGGSVTMGLLIFLVLIAVIMFVTHRFGGDSDDFSNVRASAYNILIVSLLAVAGIPLWRMAFTSLANTGFPGATHLSTYANAAG